MIPLENIVNFEYVVNYENHTCSEIQKCCTVFNFMTCTKIMINTMNITKIYVSKKDFIFKTGH